MTQPDSQTMMTMASYARHRAALWTVIEGLVGPVTDDLVARLVDGRLARELDGATHFVGDTNPFRDVIPSRRDVFEHLRANDAEREQAVVRAELERFADDSLQPAFAEAGRACIEEAEAWEAGDDEAAKAARLAQFTRLREQLEPLTTWCVRLHRGAASKPGRMVAQLVAAMLSLESGANVKGELED